MPAAAPAVLLHSLDTQQGVSNIILAMTRRDFGKPAFSLRKKRFVKTHALSLLGTTRLLSRSGGMASPFITRRSIWSIWRLAWAINCLGFASCSSPTWCWLANSAIVFPLVLESPLTNPGESLFLRKLLWASLPNKRQKLRETSNACGCPSRPASFVVYPTRGIQHHSRNDSTRFRKACIFTTQKTLRDDMDSSFAAVRHKIHLSL